MSAEKDHSGDGEPKIGAEGPETAEAAEPSLYVDDEGTLSQHGRIICAIYAACWGSGNRRTDLEEQYPDFDYTFWDIRRSPDAVIDWCMSL